MGAVLRLADRVAVVAVATASLAIFAAAGCTTDPRSPDSGDPAASSSDAPPAQRQSGQDPKSSPEPSPEPDPERSPKPKSAHQPRTVSLLVSGDVLLSEGTWRTARADAGKSRRHGSRRLDFRPMLRGVAPVLRSADLAVCHLETPLAPAGGPFAGYPAFSVPPRVVPALRHVGFDACTTASNHSLDRGTDGLERTLKTLDRYGVAHDGTGRTAQEQREPLLLDVGDGDKAVTIALLSYTFGTNGIPLPTDQQWAVSLIDPVRLVGEAAAARRAGADVVAVALHAGTEYVTAPDDYQTDVVEEITRSPDIDVVYGHHAHVPQPIDRVNGTWVAYGLGNFVAAQQTAQRLTYRGVSVRFELTERRRPTGGFTVTDIGYLPTAITGADPNRPTRVLDIRATLDAPNTPRRLLPGLRADLKAVRADVLSRGADSADPDVGVHLLRR